MTTKTYVDEKEGFVAIATEQLPRLYAIARRMVADDAEDAVQECLLRAFRRFSQLEDETSAPAWLASILINVCRDRGRSDSRRPEEISIGDIDEFSLFRTIADEDPFPYSDSLHLDFLGLFTKEDVHNVLVSMPEIYRVPLVLVHMHGFSTKEVAKMVGAPLGTVLARLHRGRKLFEKKMWDYARRSGLLKEAVR